MDVVRGSHTDKRRRDDGRGDCGSACAAAADARSSRHGTPTRLAFSSIRINKGKRRIKTAKFSGKRVSLCHSAAEDATGEVVQSLQFWTDGLTISRLLDR